MSIGILAAQTGRGHVSVMKTLYKEFINCGVYDVKCFPSFYEDMMISNKILSDFYNFLMINSTSLCRKYGEFTYLTKSDMSEDFYIGVKNFIIEFIENNDFDSIISVSHSINYSFIRILNELNLTDKINYYIVITDPFDPIAVGFATRGAKKYYCANETVEKILLKAGIEKKRIKIQNYPVDPKYYDTTKTREHILEELKFNSEKKIILINSGSQGIYYYFEILKKIVNDFPNFQIIFLCGKNSTLYKQSRKYIEKHNYINRVKVFSFIEEVQNYIYISDLVITKPGANSFYETLALEKPILIDALNGLLFQESGVVEYIKKYHVGEIFTDINDLSTVLCTMIDNKEYSQTIKKMNLSNGSLKIVKDIINERSK